MQQQQLAELHYHNNYAQQQSLYAYQQPSQYHSQPQQSLQPSFHSQQPTPPPYTTQAISSRCRPILLPATSIAGTLSAASPFIRAYPPVLSSYGISSKEFTAIIDAINIALAEPTPFTVLNVASNGVGLIPEGIAQGVSLGLGIAAGAGSAASAYIRTKRVLEKVNREVFAPKGLVVEIVKDDEVMRRLNTTAKSLDPLERLQELGPFVETLSFDVGPVIRHSNVIDRISAKQAAMKQEGKEKKKHEKETKRTRKREKAAEKYSRPVDSIDEQWNSDTEILIETEAKLAKLEGKIVDINAQADAKLVEASGKKAGDIEKRRQKDLAEVEKDRGKLHEKHEKTMAKLQKKAGKKEDKGEKKVAKLEWIMIHTARSK
ncbi:hypothetical protein BKA59DRAFT_491780 [Fusarium tricinctum]|uniref:Uncharacterized protein n=1 Tax=Fusarium tricinctum TaxID=61284 RepID=A0A8K0WCF2_9HYPO|nr:hypothetical protein BKA59DRAFT_491780 [Fusarium tricinctum]